MYRNRKESPLFTSPPSRGRIAAMTTRRLKRFSPALFIIGLVLVYTYVYSPSWIIPPTQHKQTPQQPDALDFVRSRLNSSELADLKTMLASPDISVFKSFIRTHPVPECVKTCAKTLENPAKSGLEHYTVDKLIGESKSGKNRSPNKVFHHAYNRIANSTWANASNVYIRSSHVRTQLPFGTPEFQYLRRERGSFSPIIDSIAPRSVVLTRKRALLAMTVSSKVKDRVSNLVNRFLDAEMDVILFHYDHQDWAMDDEAGVTHVRVQGQTKFWFAKRFLTPHLVENYEFLFLWDDDVFLYNNDWSPVKFIEILQKFNIHAAQPALRTGARTDFPQYNTVKLDVKNMNSGSPGRFSEFIEVMFPVFSREAWQNCIWETIPYDGRAFWGMDNVWYPHCSSLGYCRFAIIDEMAVDHMDQKSLIQNEGSNLNELSHYLNMYTGICLNKVSDLDKRMMLRTLHICNYIQHFPFGFSYRSIKRIDPVKDTSNTDACAEPDLWPFVSNKSWRGQE